MGASSTKVVVKRIVCLANSCKHSGRCVAGKEIRAGAEPGSWIRPVSDRPTEEVSLKEQQYRGGGLPQVLDIIDVPLKRSTPSSYQSENWLLDPEHYWVQVGRAEWKVLTSFADNPNQLWLNNSKTYYGANDRVSEGEAERLDHSLYFIRINQLKVSVFAPGAAFDDPRRRVLGDFEHRGTQYKLWVTDPVIRNTYLAKSDGSYVIGDCFLTISLGEAHKGYCYKLIAAVIARDRERE